MPQPLPVFRFQIFLVSFPVCHFVTYLASVDFLAPKAPLPPQTCGGGRPERILAFHEFSSPNFRSLAQFAPVGTAPVFSGLCRLLHIGGF